MSARPPKQPKQPEQPEALQPEPPMDEYGDASAFYRFSAFLGLAAAAVFAGAIVLYNARGTFGKEILALLIVAAVLGVLYVIPRLEELGAWLRTRTARQGGNVTLASIAVIGVLAVGNWYANRHSPQWDLTATGRYTLSDQSVKILSGLTQDVTVTAFLSSRNQDSFQRGTKDLLLQYQRKSSHIKLNFIDPDVNPGAARQFDIKSYPVTIFQLGDRKQETTGVTEQDFTSALLKLTRNEQKKVYFLQGHQERDPDSAQPAGYTGVVEALKRENYVTDKLTLAATGKVPDDCAVLVIAGPRAPLLDPEKQAIADYLDGGGHVLVLLDPRQDVGLSSLLDQWYVTVGTDIVVDPGSNYQGDALTPIPQPQVGHRISTSLSVMLMPGTRSMSVKPGAGSDFAIAPLLKTSPRAWGETNFSTAPRQDPEDTAGPLTLAVAVNKTDPTPAITPGAPPTPTPTAAEKKPHGRLVAVGNSEFASNTYFSQVLGNRDFLINSVDWLAEDENLISIRAQPASAPPVILSNESQVLVFSPSVVFVPLAVLLLGGAVWWQRR